jgi:hypothetical protein
VMITGAIMRTVRLRRLVNIAAPLRPDRGCLGMDFVGLVVAAAGLEPALRFPRSRF